MFISNGRKGDLNDFYHGSFVGLSISEPAADLQFLEFTQLCGKKNIQLASVLETEMPCWLKERSKENGQSERNLQ